MKIYKKIIIGLPFVFLICALADKNTANQKMPLTAEQILSAVTHLELILNKEIPSMTDFYSLYSGEAGSEEEMVVEEMYCKQVLKIKPDTQNCIDGLNRLRNNIEPKPSLFLNNIKNIVTDGRKEAIQIYISPDIKYCSPDKRGLIYADGLAVIGKSKYKSLKFAFPCTNKDAKYWVISVAEIGGVKFTQFPLTITKPFEKRP